MNTENDLTNYFYTEEEINNKFEEHLKSANAMTYKGVLNSTTLPEEAALGDVYILGDNRPQIINGEITKVGDLIIARGTENPETGLIETDLVWELIPGTEIDTTYTLGTKTDVEGKKIVLTNDTNGKS
jgi:hypothetical protein